MKVRGFSTESWLHSVVIYSWIPEKEEGAKVTLKKKWPGLEGVKTGVGRGRGGGGGDAEVVFTLLPAARCLLVLLPLAVVAADAMLGLASFGIDPVKHASHYLR